VEVNCGNQEDYTRQVLDAYRKTPGRRGPSAVRTVCWPPNFSNAACRCGYRKRPGPGGRAPHDTPRRSPPLDTIRSLAYFLPVIDEVLSLRVNPDYFRHLRHKIDRLAQTR